MYCSKCVIFSILREVVGIKVPDIVEFPRSIRCFGGIEATREELVKSSEYTN